MTVKDSNSNFHPIIILGCGPSSLSVAIQLSRANIQFLIIAEKVGGLLQNANLIENLLGFPEGITGLDFVSVMQKSVEKYDIPIQFETITEVEKKDVYYSIQTSVQEYFCEYLIIGTGTTPNTLTIPGEKFAFNSNLLFYDVYKFQGTREKQRIAIIGSGDAAHDYALNLTHPTNTIDILQRSSQSKALHLLILRVSQISNISVMSQVSVRKIELVDNQLTLEMESKQGIYSNRYDVIFVTIGRSPNISFLSPKLKDIFLTWKENETNSKKIWFIGDVKNGRYRQLALAMADGIKTAMHITAMLHK